MAQSGGSSSIFGVNRFLVIGIGTTFTVLVLFAPVLVMEHLTEIVLNATTIAALSLPVLVLILMFGTRADVVVYWLFPVAHLPALVMEPQLTSDTFYSGWPGALALVSIGVVGAAYIIAASWRTRAPTGPKAEPIPKRVRVLTWGGFAVTMAIFAAFVAPVIAQPGSDPLSGSLSVIMATMAVWVIVGGSLWTKVAAPWLDPSVRRTAVLKVLTVRRPSNRDLWASLILVTMTLLGVLVWYAARSVA